MYPIIKTSEFPSLWEHGASDRAVIRDQIDFLTTLWEPQNRVSQDLFGAFCFKRRGSTKMVQEFEWLNEDVKIGRLLRKYDRHKWDQFFSPNVYTRPKRLVNCVHLCRLGWCDIDKGNPSSFDPLPSVVWETSPGNTQALWFWDRPHTPKRASAFSKALTYRHGGDKGGSAPNKLLRVPGSFNHKPAYAKPFIPLRHYDTRLIFKRPQLLPDQGRSNAARSQATKIHPGGHDRLSVWRKYRAKLKVPTGQLLRHDHAVAPDRSRSIFLIVAGLHEVGASVAEIAGVVWTSPYFLDKYGEDLNALETEVSRIIAKLEAGQ
ncbi:MULTISPECIES: DNA-primase RepB domain-containing protein [unclassified Phaeobacter]|uniref:DNA-primase RepB domain-containing protein n=1 Tax=unclassified Phaeobacter TaxID=2621772 RepID=UPI003A84037C